MRVISVLFKIIFKIDETPLVFSILGFNCDQGEYPETNFSGVDGASAAPNFIASRSFAARTLNAAG